MFADSNQNPAEQPGLRPPTLNLKSEDIAKNALAGNLPAAEPVLTANPLKITPDSLPLGAYFDGARTTFSVMAGLADDVAVCIFDKDHKPVRTIPLQRIPGKDLWSATVFDAPPGTIYSLRVGGRSISNEGLLFDRTVDLLDPYARVVLQYPGTKNIKPADPWSERNPLAIVHDPRLKREVTHVRVPAGQDIVYECNVKGLTAKRMDVPAELRGTYLGACSPTMIDYFKELGVTSIELEPIHLSIDELHLKKHGLTNYWNYNPISYMAFDGDYASSRDPFKQVEELKQMVETFHEAGLAVYLDVVYNHTAEGKPNGKDSTGMASFRGIDPRYYRMESNGTYIDFSGCGNTFNSDFVLAQQLVLESRIYLHKEIGIDGFRDDEGTIVALREARDQHGVPYPKFEARVYQDYQSHPDLAGAVFMAEPWACGPSSESYKVGAFPNGVREWNGKFRDEVRSFWRGDPRYLGNFTTRFLGSSDIYAGRTPSDSMNFIAVHDGFSLADMTMYDNKHNEANMEDNRDGINDNRSKNWGVEGPTEDPYINHMRRNHRRALMGSLLLSRGTIIIRGGDEILQSQKGNNNAYCQDNELTHHDWNLGVEQADFLRFTKNLIAFRKEHEVLFRNRFDSDHAQWMNCWGLPMTANEWHDGDSVGLVLVGDARVPEGQPAEKETLFFAFNANLNHGVLYTLPRAVDGRWEMQIDTDLDEPFQNLSPNEHGQYLIKPCSFAVFKLVKDVPAVIAP